MIELRDLKTTELDALREIANIGAGHAATALSKLLRARVMISVPQISVSRLEEAAPVVSQPDAPVAAVLMHMLGDFTGRTLLVFPYDAAMSITRQLVGEFPAGGPGQLSSMEQSALKEVGNIVGSAYLTALGDFMNVMLLPSPPSLAVDMTGAILTTAYLQFSSDRDYVFCIENDFLMSDRDTPLRGYFMLLPDPAALNAILRALRLA